MEKKYNIIHLLSHFRDYLEGLTFKNSNYGGELVEVEEHIEGINAEGKIIKFKKEKIKKWQVGK